MSTRDRGSTTGAYMLPGDAGVIDVWLPIHPMPRGSRYTMKIAGEQSEGKLLQIHITDRRGAASPLHVHRDADETFYVIAGELTILVGDERIDARSGDFVFAPKGVPHAFLVTSEQVEVLLTYTPAGLEGFFVEVGVPVVPGEAAPEPVAPDPEEFARKSAAYGAEIVGPPPTRN